MSTPQLKTNDKTSLGSEVMLVVYAPFGADKVLSSYPERQSSDLAQHPLFRNLLRVAECGVHVCALIDLVDKETYLVEIEAGEPAEVQVVGRWKQQMNDKKTLSGLLLHAHRWQSKAALVLAMEGHGAGYLPEIDVQELAASRRNLGNDLQWVERKARTTLEGADGAQVPLEGAPILTMDNPTLPMDNPTLPGLLAPLSTWALGTALKDAIDAGMPKLSVIHFNNCFNMSVELLHTVAPYAEQAAGYINYNFFTAGETYPKVFKQLQAAGSATAERLSMWLADENGKYLADQKNHPTVGCSMALGRMAEIAERVDDLSDALLAALRVPDALQRAVFVSRIKQAIVDAQQLDSDGSMQLETPDEMTDLLSFAHTLRAQDFGPFRVREAAVALEESLAPVILPKPAPIKRYGAVDQPWTMPAALWDFSSDRLAMSIFLPDPLNEGLWDWRSPYYMNVNSSAVQPNIIEFLQVTDWVDFLIEYHRKTPFVGLLPVELPRFPAFNEDSDKLDYPKPQPPCRPGKTPKKLKGP